MSISISAFMTHDALWVAPESPIGQAWALMRKHHVRHLPVLTDGKVVGILSQRDLLKLESLANVDRTKDPVSDAMTLNPYVVGPNEPMAGVVSAMAMRKLGCAIVVQADRPPGIFTTTDALHAFATWLRGSGENVRHDEARHEGGRPGSKEIPC